MIQGCIVRTKKRNKLNFELLNQQTVFGRLIWRDFPEVLTLSRAFDCAVMVTLWAEFAGAIPLRVRCGDENPGDQLYELLWRTTFDVRREAKQ